MLIPKQLRNKEFRFIKIQKQDKKPIEKDWSKTNNYIYTDIELINWLSNGNNYGVLCGKGYLTVIDCDKKEIADIVEQKLPETFTVETGSGGKHYYYIVRDIDKTIVLTKKENDEEIHYGEIRNNGSQVIGPSSIHPNGNEYKIIKNSEIKEIHKTTLETIFKDYIKNDEYIIKKENVKRDYDKIDISNIIKTLNLERHGNEFQGSHPIHGSTTGHNFSINIDKNVWHCFRHNTGGGIVTLIAMLNKIINCSDCREGCVTPTIFKDVVKIAKEKYDIEIKGDK